MWSVKSRGHSNSSFQYDNKYSTAAEYIKQVSYYKYFKNVNCFILARVCVCGQIQQTVNTNSCNLAQWNMAQNSHLTGGLVNKSGQNSPKDWYLHHFSWLILIALISLKRLMSISKYKYNFTWQLNHTKYHQHSDLNNELEKWPNPAICLLSRSINASMRQTALSGQLIKRSIVLQNERLWLANITSSSDVSGIGVSITWTRFRYTVYLLAFLLQLHWTYYCTAIHQNIQFEYFDCEP